MHFTESFLRITFKFDFLIFAELNDGNANIFIGECGKIFEGSDVVLDHIFID
jgi:hypothetical protein